jgi:hypothetical protein
MRKVSFCCASGFPNNFAQRLPVLFVNIDGCSKKALLDTGCSRSVLSCSSIGLRQREQEFHEIVMMNGKKVECLEGHSTRN